MKRKADNGFFEITCVHREDVQAVLDIKDDGIISKITDDIMSEIASKMEDDYCNQMFHYSLLTVARNVLKEKGILA